MRSLLLLPLLFASCTSVGYHRDFAKATKALPVVPTTPEGPWKGTWKSQTNGHTGPIWCILQPSAEQAGKFDFRYRAGWGMLQFGDYTHTVPAAIAGDGSLALKGKMELPAGGGTYTVDGTLSPTSFEAKYSSKADRGTMSLQRP